MLASLGLPATSVTHTGSGSYVLSPAIVGGGGQMPTEWITGPVVLGGWAREVTFPQPAYKVK